MTGDAKIRELAERARSIRRTVLLMCRGRGQGYAGQGLALADLMACLYFSELWRTRDGALRDRLVLSTGHSAIAVYAALRELGIYELDELCTYGMDGSRIEESPLEGTPGFEITGGSLGQGLSQAVGMAWAERFRATGNRIYCLISDGELQEGQVWEALMSAAHHRLDNLVVLVDNNKMQADGPTAEIMTVEPIVQRLTSFGVRARRVDGNDIAQLLDALAEARGQGEAPSAIVCDTVPGKGVPSFEAYAKVHYIRLERAEWDRALEEVV